MHKTRSNQVLATDKHTNIMSARNSSYFSFIFLSFFLLGKVNGQDFGSQQIITTAADGAQSVYATDLDGDGDADVLSASNFDDRIAWYENLGGGSFGSQQIITTAADWAYSVYATDLDGDSDADVLSASYWDDKIAWYENLGGGSFGSQQIITTAANGAISVYATDLDGDGDADVLSASYFDDKIAWYENLGGGSFGSQQVITTAADWAYSVYATDLDGDGDADVLSASSVDDKIAWYENLGGGSFGSQQVITMAVNGAISVYATDLDGDGDADVLSASYFDDKIAWYENLGGGSFGSQQIITTNADGAISVYATDLDGDGDADVLSASFVEDKIAWYENLGGGSFGSQQIITTAAVEAFSVYATDLDGDGDADVLSASSSDDKIAWYENLIGFNITPSILTFPCVGSSNGVIQISTSGPRRSPFNYYWTLDGGLDSGNGMESNDIFTIDNLIDGSYDILVIDANGDSASIDNYVLNSQLGSYFEIVDITTTNSSNGLNNGSIDISIAGGSPNYSYSWSGPVSGNQVTASNSYTITNMLAGTYTITVIEDGGSQSQYTVTLLDETVPQSTCQDGLDVVILNDVSGSVDGTEYFESKQFFVDFINALNIGNAINNANVAVVEWSSTGEQTTKIPLTGNLATLQNYNNASRAYSGGTNPQDALTFGKNYLENNGRAGVPKVLVLSTDASSSQVSGSLIALAEQYKAEGYFIVTIAFDGAFSNGYTNNILRQVASADGVVYGAPAYSQLNNTLAETIVNLYVCPVDPGSSNTVFFNRDGVIEITGFLEIGFCPNPESVDIELTITAQQQLSLPPGTPITFYYNNPELFGATPILTSVIPCAIPAGTSEDIIVNLPISNPANVYAVLNDDGSQLPPISFPITNIEEYVFLNNIDNVSICTDPLPTVSALKYTTTPIPVCDSVVIYNVDVCNISSVDAIGVLVTDIPPTGAVLLSENINYNGCSSGSGTYAIPTSCCVSITYTYDISDVANGFYNDQDVTLSGPGGQVYINFDGSPTVMEDVEISDDINCISDVVTFFKDVNITEICEESFVTFTFTIDNQTNVDIFNLDFTDNLPAPVIWAAEPYLLDGVSIGQSTITGSQNANFTIDIVEANTTASFYMDAYLGDWINNGVLTNTATIEDWPSFVNSNGDALTATAPSVNVYVLPTVDAENLVQINSDEVANLQSTILDGINPVWMGDGDGSFIDANVEDAIYIPGIQDIQNGIVHFTISAESPLTTCGEALDTVRLEINKVYDFGDAPDVYNTLSASNGAHHFLTYLGKQALFLGSNNADDENNGQPVTIGQMANNDDNVEEDDENGVIQFPPLYNNMVGNYSVAVQTQNLLVSNATLLGWIDFNKDQEWTTSESASANVTAGSSLQNINLNFNLPAVLDTGITYVRFRITTDNLSDAGGTSIDERSFGIASDGEVEDYELYIQAGNVEICDNGIDDDGDGAIDTADVDCQTCQALFIANSICLGETNTFDASTTLASPQANITSYYWEFDVGNTGNQMIEQHTYNTSGNYDVLLVIEDDSSCVDSLTQTISIYAIPNVQLTTVGSYCLNEGSVVLSNGSPVGGIYVGNGISNDSIFSPQVAGIGTHTIQYIFDDGNGCADTAITTISVNSMPTVSFNPITDICLVDGIIVLSGESPVGGIFEGIGIAGNTFDPSISGTGTFDIQYVYIDNNACSDTAIQPITVLDTELDTINAVICEGETYTLSNGQLVTTAGFYPDSMLNVGTCGLVEFTNLSVQDHSIDTIQAVLCGGSSYVLPNGPSVSQPGIYVDSLKSVNDCDSTIVTVLALDESGCLEECFLTAPTAFTPDDDHINDIFYILTTCDEIFTAFEFTIYNRWGEAVFTTNSISNGWDGKAFGLEAEMDVYTFRVNFNRERVGQNEVFAGVFLLIR